MRESDFAVMTKAGTEIGVASTKAFTTQLTVLLMLVAYLGRLKGKGEALEHSIVTALHALPSRIESMLSQDKVIEQLAEISQTRATHCSRAARISSRSRWKAR